MITHILPSDDEREHDESPYCWCGPSVEIIADDGSSMYVHNAADRREEHERATGKGLPGKLWLRVTDEGD